LSDTTPHDPLPPVPTPLPHQPPPSRSDVPEGWYEEPDELPPRPRARFLTPLTVVLMLVLFAACGFVGGVLVQKNQGGSSTTTFGAAAASRFGSAASGASGASGAAGAGAGGFSRFGSLFGGAGGGDAIGTVTDINGNKLYVTTAAGTMTEVITTPESKFKKSESVGLKSIQPGDSVVVSGVTGPSGAITASTVTDSGDTGTSSSTGASSLFGGGGTTSTSGSAGLFGGG
jgi:hypothetical protein